MTREIRIRLIQACQAIVGADGVISTSDELRVYECDALTTRHKAMPELVVLPTTSDQVAAVVRLCAAEGVPIVPRGAGTGLSGGAIPSAGGVLIALTRMTRIREIDAPNRTATVEAGCINLAISRAVMPHGFFFAPDPASQQASTIGGNVAENAGGPHCLKYGATTNHVRGATVVFPDGEIVQLGGRMADRPGYDLLGVFVGSEGTLGVVVKAWLRILPLPQTVCTVLAGFASVGLSNNSSRTRLA